MVKKITVIPVNNNSNEEITQDIINVQEKETVEENIIKLEDDIIREKDEINTNVELDVKPTTKGKKKIHNNMPTTEKVLTQVQCQACGKSMSAKNLRYSHAAYCIKRVQEADKPKTIPVPKKIMKNLMKLKMVKDVEANEELYDETDLLKEDVNNKSNNDKIKLSEFNNMEIKRLEALKRPPCEVRKQKRDYIKPPDEELYDSEGEIFKGSIIPSDNIEMNNKKSDNMTELKKQIMKAQEEYILNNKKSDLPMYKVNNALRPEDIEPPLYEVRIKNARQKKQEKYDKLMLKAF